MALGGRPEGRDKRQESIWNENEKKIVYALMDKHPHSASIEYLRKKTKLSRNTLYNHIKSLQKKGVINYDKELGLVNLNSILFREERRRIFLPQGEDFEVDIGKIDRGIIVVRAEADKEILFEVTSGGRIITSGESKNIASTIPHDTPSQVKAKLKANEPTTLGNFQIAVFPPLNE